MRSYKIALILVVALVAATFSACGPLKARCADCGKVVKVTTLRGVLFDFDKSEVRPDGVTALKEDIDLLNKDSKLDVSIEGHCDIIGTDAYNQTLSLKRATSVFEYLVRNGIAANRMTTIGYGRKQPLVPNDTEANRALNRRVEIKIIKARP